MNDELIEDVELSFKLLEFSIRTMCYSELEKFDIELFGQNVLLKLEEENFSYPKGQFTDKNNIIRAAQMAVSTAFGSTAICLDCALEKVETNDTNMKTAKEVIYAVRNAFSHGIAAPNWFVKKYKHEIQLNLDFINGPILNLGQLHKQPFSYSQVGGFAAWYRLKDYVLNNIQNT